MNPALVNGLSLKCLYLLLHYSQSLHMFKMIGSEVFIPIQVARMGKSMLRGEESNQTLFRVVDQKPFSVTLQFDFPPNRSDYDTTIELQYKRVPYKDNAHPDSILDNPVIESFTVDKSIDSYNFTIMDVPKGKYIICAMNLTSDVMFEPDPNTTFECIEVFIEKYGGHRLQTGVYVIVVLAMILVFCAIIFSLFNFLRNYVLADKNQHTIL